MALPYISEIGVTEIIDVDRKISFRGFHALIIIAFDKFLLYSIIIITCQLYSSIRMSNLNRIIAQLLLISSVFKTPSNGGGGGQVIFLFEFFKYIINLNTCSVIPFYKLIAK